MRKRTPLALALLLACLLPLLPETFGQDTGETRDGVFIHLTKGPEDPHRVLMALRMADIMAEDHPVLLYADIQGVRVLLEDADPLETPPFPDSRTLLDRLLDQGVQIMACPGCLKAVGKSGEDLREGVQVADKSAFFDFTGGRILTLDY